MTSLFLGLKNTPATQRSTTTFVYAYAILGVLITLFSFISASAQSLSNDPDPTRWISYSQNYYKIPIAKAGLYRITTSELQRAGIPIQQINPVTIQLVHRGVEQAIYVEGENDQRFDATDFLEFYGRGNDGIQDSLLYEPTTAQPHTYYSLFSDTTAYFLTWRLDNKPGKRMQAYTDTTYAGLQPEPYHWEEELRVFTDTYPAGTIYPLGAGYGNGSILSNYDTGEGWTGPVVTAGNRFDQMFSLTNFSHATDSSGSQIRPKASYLLVGRSARLHRIACLAGSSITSLQPLDTAHFSDYRSLRIDTEIDGNAISSSGSLVLSAQPNEIGEEISVSYLKLRYPQRTDLTGKSQKLFHLRSNVNGRSWLNIANTPANTRLFDISDSGNPIRIQISPVAQQWKGVIRNSQSERTLLATNQPMKVPAIRPVTFRKFATSNANFLIITHPLLQQPAGNEANPIQAYAAYRASEAGGRFDTLTVNISQLVDQFSYGERHPLAIRRFADYMLRSGNSRPKFLFLVGQSLDPQSIRKLANGELLDMVPNAGWPGSDIALVEGLQDEPAHVPALAIGRLNASQSQQVLDYLTKVKSHENTSEPALWRKNSLHLSGGRSVSELKQFRQFIDDFTQTMQTSYVGARVTTLSKQTDNPVEVLPITDLVNQGVGMISLFGHSGLDVADVDIGFVSNDLRNYRNKGRYPFLLVNGCASGNVYFGRPTFGNDWILTPDRGAVLFLAHTYNGFVEPLKRYSDQLYALLADSQYVSKPIGVIQQETIRRFLKANTSVYDVTTAQQMTLQGDPAIRVFPFSMPDVAFELGSLQRVENQADSVRLSGVVVNYGRATYRPLTLRIRHYKSNGQLIHEQAFTHKTPFYADTLNWAFPALRNNTDTTYFELVLDPDNQIPETNEMNNSAVLSSANSVQKPPFVPDVIAPILDVAFDGKRISNGELVSAQPIIDILLQDENKRLVRTDTVGLELYVQPPCVTLPCPYERLNLRESNIQRTVTESVNSFRFSYQPRSPLPDGQYTLAVAGSDLSGNRAAMYQIRFRVRNALELMTVGVYPNPFSQWTRFFTTISGDASSKPVTLRITDLSGKLVRTFQEVTRIGLNEWYWDGTSDSGILLPAGVYLYTFTGSDIPIASSVSLTGRILLTR
ncbi:hypothetical protein GCM10028807_13930 [Spirosoma daeguense]